MSIKRLKLPLTSEELTNLTSGDIVYLTGKMYTARDMAHQKLCYLIKDNLSLPINLNQATIYYTGPTPTKPNQIIGSAGPTSSYRMDPYAQALMEKGVKIMIGKGPRSKEYQDLLTKYQAVYISAIGGAGATISKTIKACQVVAYEELGPEAIHELEVENFFGVVVYDTKGNDLFMNNN